MQILFLSGAHRKSVVVHIVAREFIYVRFACKSIRRYNQLVAIYYLFKCV